MLVRPFEKPDDIGARRRGQAELGHPRQAPPAFRARAAPSCPRPPI
jgi:hypothetical protein